MSEDRPPLLQVNAALYLDFDGTLAAFAPDPDGVTVHDSLPALLAELREKLVWRSRARDRALARRARCNRGRTAIRGRGASRPRMAARVGQYDFVR